MSFRINSSHKFAGTSTRSAAPAPEEASYFDSQYPLLSSQAAEVRRPQTNKDSHVKKGSQEGMAIRTSTSAAMCDFY
jgi:hypothetical protein